MKNKFVIIPVVVLSTIIYYYSNIYIEYFCFSFDDVLIDIDKYPDLWKWSPSILTLIASFIILIFSYVYVNFAEKIFHIKPPQKQLTKKEKYIFLSLSLLGGIMIVFAQYFIYPLFLNEITNQEVNNFELWYLPALITTCFTYPIAEEIFFRKGIFNFLNSKFNILISITLSSLLFSSIHFPNYRQMVTTLIGGIFIGILYEKTSKLIYPIIFHISWNTTIVILNFIPLP